MKITSVSFNAPELTPISNDTFKFVKDLNVCVNFKDKDPVRFRIPVGFITDFGSVPWLFQPIIPKFGDWGISIAYFVHDFNYTTHEFSKAYSDDLLYYMLKDAGMGTVKAYAVKTAVKAFGGNAWKEGYDSKVKNRP